MEILTLLKANLKHRKSSFISIFILMVIVSAILTSALSISDDVTRRVTQANDEIGTGDIVAFISDMKYTDEMQSKLEESKCTERIKAIDSFFSSDTVINGTKPDVTIFYSSYDSADKPYGIFNNDADGFVNDTAPLKDGEIYLPIGMKSMCSCKKGDEVLLGLSDGTFEFTIAGFIEEPFTGCDVISIKNLLITENDLKTIRDESTVIDIADMTENPPVTPIKLVHIFATGEYKSDTDALNRAVNDETGIIDESINTITREHAQTYTLLLPLLMCGVLYLFLALLMTVVALVLSNNIGTSIEMEYVNIGILKSQGFTKGKIRLVYLLQYLFPAVLGALVGLLLSFPTVDLIRPAFITVSCLMVSNELLLGKSIIILFVILSLLCLFIFAKTSKVSRISPIRAISGGLDDVHFSSVFRTPVIGKTKAAIGFRLAMRQLTSNLKQYVGICVILTFLVFYLSTCNALLKNFTKTFYDELYGIVSADVCVNYKDNIDIRSEVEKEISSVSPIKGSFAYSEGEFFVDDVPYTMQVIDNFSYLSHFIDGKFPEYDNEIIISNFLSRKINKTIGDKIMVKHGDTSREFIICATYDSIHFAGSTFAISFEAAKSVNPEIEPNSILYIIEDKTMVSEINNLIDNVFDESGIETANPKRQSESTINTAMGVLNAMILFIFIIAIVFAVIVVWMVCKKSFLKERKNIGIYKAYGFSTFGLKMQFCLRYLIVALAASVFGVTLYTFFGDALNLTTFMALGVTQFHAPLTPESYIIPPALMCFFSFLASYITMGKINKVSSRELVVE